MRSLLLRYPEVLISSPLLSVLHSVTVYYLLTGGPVAGLSPFPHHQRQQQEETEELYPDRERRETRRKVAGNVEFVHPDLKAELSSQDEDPNNPWVWLTSYSRIPVGQTDQSCLVLSL